jgi:hypothetical protein
MATRIGRAAGQLELSAVGVAEVDEERISD